MRHRVIVCATCRNKGEADFAGPELAKALRDSFAADPLLQDFTVETHDCLSACAKPNSLSFRADGKAAYLFAGVDPVADRSDIAAFARLYAQSGDGWIEDARPAGRLRFCLIGRIPA
ncbi:DUF1636 family protein [Neptunicoccus sediminis]|uniref:DUF1636 family protein n=1 Tax=Neptunicoccus sediminis TaxID=1892596 RepID=UPI0009F72AAE|nr:DUF1636 domain-containing protein [Neptunicoccus sediminis]